jgi:peroxiredoxin
LNPLATPGQSLASYASDGVAPDSSSALATLLVPPHSDTTISGRSDPMTTDAHDSANQLLPPGVPAPPFTLPAGPDQSLSLDQFRGRPVVLVFYPADWSPVCGDQLALYNEILADFQELEAQVLGISVDGPWCHRAYAEARNLNIPLLSDFEPKGAVAREYGAYEATGGVARRALFVIDGEGVIRWSYLSPFDVNPGADGILAALEQIQGRTVS